MTTSKLSNIVGPAFYDVHKAVKNGGVAEIVLTGGRASLKSSYASVEIILQLLTHPDVHAVVLRKVANTLRNSVYAQMKWAIDQLGLRKKFQYSRTPMEMTYKLTGQKIFFFGLDDPDKVKSIKVEHGYIGLLWFEELDQYAGPEEIRNVEQSTLRGGPYSLSIKSFNPPAATRNWANQYVRESKPRQLIKHTTYLQAPADWLGPRFLADAEHLKATKPTKYRHEYLGEAVGNGTQVFDNIVLREIIAQEIRNFANPLNGVDWGWYPDPWAYNRVYYDAARRILYIYSELTRLKTSNRETAQLVLKQIQQGEVVTADSAEPKSCGDYRAFGIRCREAEKGPGSVNQSIKWLQSLAAIIIDPQRCPDTAKEFAEYEYETTKDGEVLSGYVDADNHHIDATRYATNRVWLRKGT